MCIVNFFLVVVVILCTDVYGQLTECWMQSCTIMKALEATSQTIMTKQDELNSKLGSTFSVPSIADVESNITSTFSADISTAESNVITALESSKEDVIMSVNSSMTDTIAKINDAIAAEVGASEGNVVSTLMSELATSESKVITVVNASIADTVSKINDATAAEMGASENNVVSAFISELATSENKVLTAFNGSNADTIAKLDDTIAAVSASEDNVVSSLKSELQISENKVITAVLGEMEMSQKNLTTKLDEVLSVINSTPAPPSSGFTVDSNVQAIRIELDIFAGVVNPSWMLTNSSSEFSSVLAVVNGARSTSLPVRVGYRGFIVIFALEDGSSISQTFGHAKQMSTTLETALLNSHGSVPSNEIIAIATATINVLTTPDIGGPQGSLDPAGLDNFNPQCGKSRACSEPDFDNQAWNSALDNSYNYAMNTATFTYAQPGRGAGSVFTELSGEIVRAAAVLDGLMDHDDTLAGLFPTSNNCLTALVLIPGVDFHFYRRNSDGNWSHKPGPRPPTNLDNAGNIITDPRTADMAPYRFVRFLSACPRKITIN